MSLSSILNIAWNLLWFSSFFSLLKILSQSSHIEFCSNIMLLFLVFLYLFNICAFLLTNFVIQTNVFYKLILFYLTSSNNWISLNSFAMCLNSASGFNLDILAFFIWTVLWRTCQLDSNIKTAVIITKSKCCQSFRPKL